MIQKPRYEPGNNIALKLPPEQMRETVRFYKDILGFELLKKTAGSFVFDFNGKRLWLDPVPSLSQSELWLEVLVDDAKAAATHLKQEGVTRRDEIEPLPENLNAFWIKSPSSTIHLVSEK